MEMEIIDIAVGDRILQHILVLLANGSGSFENAGYFGINSGLGSIAVADLNGDGRPDLIRTSEIDFALQPWFRPRSCRCGEFASESFVWESRRQQSGITPNDHADK